MGGNPRDDLLQPTLGAHQGRAPDDPRPWRLGSQVYVAFFGGAIAVGIIAALNARRLGLGSRELGLIAAATLAGVAGSLAAAASIDSDTVRLAVRAVGLATYGLVYLIQRSADRVYGYHAGEDEEYESLVGPGLAAVVAGLVIEVPLFAAVAAD